MFDDIAPDDPPYTPEEIAQVRPHAQARLRRCLKKLGYSGLAFFLSCSAVVPFSEGHSLHGYAEPFGRLLVYLSMGLLIPFGISAGVAFYAWVLLRDLDKTSP